MSENKLRIIGGRWRGRKLNFPAEDGLRPTHDRLRETLFNWLMHDIHDAMILDLFAGSGALGFEALSRGAKFVSFVDQNQQVCQKLRDNAAMLGVTSCDVICNDYWQVASKSLKAPYDVVFLDPPFRSNLLLPAIEWLEAQNLLADNAKIYVEVEKSFTLSPIPPGWILSRSKSTSTLDCYLFKRNSG